MEQSNRFLVSCFRENIINGTVLAFYGPAVEGILLMEHPYHLMVRCC